MAEKSKNFVKKLLGKESPQISSSLGPLSPGTNIFEKRRYEQARQEAINPPPPLEPFVCEKPPRGTPGNKWHLEQMNRREAYKEKVRNRGHSSALQLAEYSRNPADYSYTQQELSEAVTERSSVVTGSETIFGSQGSIEAPHIEEPVRRSPRDGPVRYSVLGAPGQLFPPPRDEGTPHAITDVARPPQPERTPPPPPSPDRHRSGLLSRRGLRIQELLPSIPESGQPVDSQDEDLALPDSPDSVLTQIHVPSGDGADVELAGTRRVTSSIYSQEQTTAVGPLSTVPVCGHASDLDEGEPNAGSMMAVTAQEYQYGHSVNESAHEKHTPYRDSFLYEGSNSALDTYHQSLKAIESPSELVRSPPTPSVSEHCLGVHPSPSFSTYQSFNEGSSGTSPMIRNRSAIPPSTSEQKQAPPPTPSRWRFDKRKAHTVTPAGNDPKSAPLGASNEGPEEREKQPYHKRSASTPSQLFGKRVAWGYPWLRQFSTPSTRERETSAAPQPQTPHTAPLENVPKEQKLRSVKTSGNLRQERKVSKASRLLRRVGTLGDLNHSRGRSISDAPSTKQTQTATSPLDTLSPPPTDIAPSTPCVGEPTSFANQARLDEPQQAAGNGHRENNRGITEPLVMVGPYPVIERRLEQDTATDRPRAPSEGGPAYGATPTARPPNCRRLSGERPQHDDQDAYLRPAPLRIASITCRDARPATSFQEGSPESVECSRMNRRGGLFGELYDEDDEERNAATSAVAPTPRSTHASSSSGNSLLLLHGQLETPVEGGPATPRTSPHTQREETGDSDEEVTPRARLERVQPNALELWDPAGFHPEDVPRPLAISRSRAPSAACQTVEDAESTALGYRSVTPSVDEFHLEERPAHNNSSRTATSSSAITSPESSESRALATRTPAAPVPDGLEHRRGKRRVGRIVEEAWWSNGHGFAPATRPFADQLTDQTAANRESKSSFFQQLEAMFGPASEMSAGTSEDALAGLKRPERPSTTTSPSNVEFPRACSSPIENSAASQPGPATPAASGRSPIKPTCERGERDPAEIRAAAAQWAMRHLSPPSKAAKMNGKQAGTDSPPTSPQQDAVPSASNPRPQTQPMARYSSFFAGGPPALPTSPTTVTNITGPTILYPPPRCPEGEVTSPGQTGRNELDTSAQSPVEQTERSSLGYQNRRDISVRAGSSREPHLRHQLLEQGARHGHTHRQLTPNRQVGESPARDEPAGRVVDGVVHPAFRPGGTVDPDGFINTLRSRFPSLMGAQLNFERAASEFLHQEAYDTGDADGDDADWQSDDELPDTSTPHPADG